MVQGGVTEKNWANDVPRPPGEGTNPSVESILQWATSLHSYLERLSGDIYANAVITVGDNTPPGTGRLRFNETTKKWQGFDGTSWVTFTTT